MSDYMQEAVKEAARAVLNVRRAERKARELDGDRLAGDKAQYVVQSIELVEEK